MVGQISRKKARLSTMNTLKILILFGSASLALTAQRAAAQDITDFIQSGIRKNPTILSARAALKAERESLVQARSNYLPTMSLNAGISSTNRDAQLQDGTTFSDTTNPTSASIALDQTLYTGGLRNALTARAKLQSEISATEYQSTELQIASEITEAYCALWLSRETLQAETAYEKLIYEQLEIAKERNSRGVGTQTEISQVQARLSIAQARLGSAQRRLKTATSYLQSLSGMDVISSITLPEQTYIKLSEPLIQDILKFSPQIAGAELRSRLERISAMTSSRQNSPQISFRLEASLSRESSPAIDQDDDLRASLNFSMPLYDGGRSRSETRAALRRRQQILYEAGTLKLNLRNEVEQQFSDLEIATLEIAAFKDALTSSENVLQGLKEGKAVGLWSTKDILDATEDLISTKLSLAEAKNRVAIATSKLLILSGDLEQSGHR